MQNTRLRVSRQASAHLTGVRRTHDVLVCGIGSTDPTACAGLARSLIVFDRLGAKGALAVAAVTAQNDAGVDAVLPLPAETLQAQLNAIWSQQPPDAVSIGLLPASRSIQAVRHFLRELEQRPPIVMDPVLAASSGASFGGAEEIALLRLLMPICTVVTPNAAEAQMLSGIRLGDVEDARRAATHLSELGCAVLVKGGHLGGSRSVDVLARDGKVVREFSARRLKTAMRGTGCVLAAALTVALARGETLERAVAAAKQFVHDEMRRTR